MGPMRTRLHVIAGDARGRVLEVPEGARPTAGRVREALFASLGEVTGLRVLDLFAGSGAVAIEALSRGAGSAVLVERDRAAVEVCRANLETTDTAPNARVVPASVDAFLTRAAPPEAPFDLVWCDPPYGADPAELDAVRDALGAPGWLGPDARIVLERPARRRAAQDEPPDPARADPAEVGADSFEVTWERKYGDTLVTVLRSRERPDDRA